MKGISCKKFFGLFVLILLLCCGCSKVKESYNVVAEEYTWAEEDMDIEVSYPQIKSGTFNVDVVNQMIKDVAVKGYNEPYEFERIGLTVSVDYEIIYQTENIFSVMFQGVANVKGAAHPTNLCYAVTVDLKEQTVLGMNSFWNEQKDIFRQIEEGGYAVVQGGMQTFSKDKISEKVAEVYERQLTDNIYIDEEAVYLIVTDLPYAMGSYSVLRFEN
ncbi:MAG: hypothetical protein UHS49_02685 [Faecalimonas sp.]|nr:hypothetical protein [Faecalimonas sp.]